MRLLDYIELGISAYTKLAVCLTIGSAFFLVYCWEPGKRKKKAEAEPEGTIAYWEVNPKHLNRSTNLLKLETKVNPVRHENDTLEHLEDYIQTLKQHHIRNIDGV